MGQQGAVACALEQQPGLRGHGVGDPHLRAKLGLQRRHPRGRHHQVAQTHRPAQRGQALMQRTADRAVADLRVIEGQGAAHDVFLGGPANLTGNSPQAAMSTSTTTGPRICRACPMTASARAGASSLR